MPTKSKVVIQTDSFETPMMIQYLKIKAQYPDCILFFRLGDFYEMFMDDAKIGASVLDIALTSRDRGKDGRIPMAGIPFHAVDSYLYKFIKAGYKVAICEQIGDTSAPGLVERDVVRIITPGTLVNENVLDKKENNFITAINIGQESFGVALADLSTGYFAVDEYPLKLFEQLIVNDLTKYNPSECLLSPVIYNDSKILKTLKNHKNLNVFPYFEWDSAVSTAGTDLLSHFKIKDLSSFGINDLFQAQSAAAALLAYLKFTQKGDVSHIRKIDKLGSAEHLTLDRSTIYNLELFTTLRDGSRKGTLLDFIDCTHTPMGGRLLKQWLSKPLLKVSDIAARQDSIECLLADSGLRAELQQKLESLMDIERILSRLAVGVGNPRDVINLAQSLEISAEIKERLDSNYDPLISSIKEQIDKEALDLDPYIRNYFIESPPFDPKSGGYVKGGVNKELDSLRATVKGSKDFILNLEQKEKEKTGISSLKVKFNQVFGYYIEVTKSNLSAVPGYYTRKQTMVNAERFITPELKHHEEIILTAEEQIKEIEYSVFCTVVTDILDKTENIQKSASALATLDCILSLTLISLREEFVRPKVDDSDLIEIEEGRHPVVEKSLPLGEFVPNDVCLNNGDKQLLVITGPNMSGKSVYIRQVGIIVILAQMGCYVPARTARIGVVDNLFVRSGASDFIAGGLSTFMVEMVETAYILNNCTEKSLIIMDEIGRGTSTYDGISIAWAVADYLVSTKHSKTLFATHYHELQHLEDLHKDRIKNMQVTVNQTSEGPVFLHKVVPGAALHSFGIDVAKLAGVPPEVYIKALAVLEDLRARATSPEEKPALVTADIPIVTPFSDLDLFIDQMKTLDLSNTTPLEALNILAELKQIWDRNYNGHNS
ncbi:DNA mismatch repair protein MutS [candidate division WWE3 bacterium]|uniref:DNA mismatch repair protein MutS n=1 Tax=candidate division WWE3 bacterium TaxID=2053526 RepID=A0A7X9DKY8_UNCKA|nr:DNA mismatch repair protein MutS [candidate division WWE3 bacterium]